MPTRVPSPLVQPSLQGYNKRLRWIRANQRTSVLPPVTFVDLENEATLVTFRETNYGPKLKTPFAKQTWKSSRVLATPVTASVSAALLMQRKKPMALLLKKELVLAREFLPELANIHFVEIAKDIVIVSRSKSFLDQVSSDLQEHPLEYHTILGTALGYHPQAVIDFVRCHIHNVPYYWYLMSSLHQQLQGAPLSKRNFNVAMRKVFATWDEA